MKTQKVVKRETKTLRKERDAAVLLAEQLRRGAKYQDEQLQLEKARVYDRRSEYEDEWRELRRQTKALCDERDCALRAAADARTERELAIRDSKEWRQLALGAAEELSCIATTRRAS